MNLAGSFWIMTGVSMGNVGHLVCIGMAIKERKIWFFYGGQSVGAKPPRKNGIGLDLLVLKAASPGIGGIQSAPKPIKRLLIIYNRGTETNG